jgi:hypothetical protein
MALLSIVTSLRLAGAFGSPCTGDVEFYTD